MEKKYHKMTITLENVSQAQAIALKKMFEYMEYLGKMGMSRNCTFFADGDGDFRPKVFFEYPEELPDVNVDCIVEYDKNTKEFLPNKRTHSGDFIIDFDDISWEIYH